MGKVSTVQIRRMAFENPRIRQRVSLFPSQGTGKHGSTRQLDRRDSETDGGLCEGTLQARLAPCGHPQSGLTGNSVRHSWPSEADWIAIASIKLSSLTSSRTSSPFAPLMFSYVECTSIPRLKAHESIVSRVVWLCRRRIG